MLLFHLSAHALLLCLFSLEVFANLRFHQLNCQAVTGSFCKFHLIDINADCRTKCQEQTIQHDFYVKLLTNDRCQGEQGFSDVQFSSEPLTVLQEDSRHGLLCRCKINFTAKRVYKYDLNDLSCAVPQYLARILQVPFSDETYPPIGIYFVTGQAAWGCHCDKPKLKRSLRLIDAHRKRSARSIDENRTIDDKTSAETTDDRRTDGAFHTRVTRAK